MQREFTGIGVSPGIAIARAYFTGGLRDEVPSYDIEDPEQEIERLLEARDRTREELRALYVKTATELGETHAEILNAHLLLLDDEVILEDLFERIRSQRRNAEAVVFEVAAANAHALEESEDPMLRERRDDLLDVADRIIRRLMDEDRPDLHQLDHPVILVGTTLPPSDMASVNMQTVRGLALDHGGKTSHTALLARALGIPAVMGLEDLSIHTGDDSLLVIDGTLGKVIVNPTKQTLAWYEEAQRAYLEQRKLYETASGAGPCHTRDGVPIETLANVALPFEVTERLRTFAQGIGLYRTEFLFLNRATLPCEEEQYKAYLAAAEIMAPRPVTFRTMDIGGDKFVSSLGRPREDNPQLGWRALRFCLDRVDIFKTQLRAILRASVTKNVRLMFPMVGGIPELHQAKAVLQEVREEFDERGIDYDREMKVGVMIEVPSAVTIADMLAKESDFFSIGTNDLIQYTLAVDRGNEAIAHLYESSHPAVLRMIKHTAEVAKAAGIPCEVCGEMASVMRYTQLLVGLGVRSFSMSAVALPQVRTLLSLITIPEAEALAAQALQMTHPADVENLVRERCDSVLAMVEHLRPEQTSDEVTHARG